MLKLLAIGTVLASLAYGGLQLAHGSAAPNPPTAGSASASEPIQQSRGSPVHASGLDLATRTRTISLDEYEGRPMIVNVWASWCEACRVEGPEYARFEHAHPEVVIVGVDIQDAPTDAVLAMQGWGWTHESIWDPKGMVGASMPRHDGIPLTFFLDRNHHVVDTVLSNVSYQQLLAGAARIGAV